MSKSVNASLAMNGVQTAVTSTVLTQESFDVGKFARKTHLDITAILVGNALCSDGRGLRPALAKSRSCGSLDVAGGVLDARRPDARERNDYSFGAGRSIPLPPGSGG